MPTFNKSKLQASFSSEMSRGIGGGFVLMMAAAFMSSTVIHKDCCSQTHK